MGDEGFDIRIEEPADLPAIYRVNEAAFGRGQEAEAVEALRANGKAVLSLVAVSEGEVVGHVMFSHATIEAEARTVVEAALGPIAVVPERQGKGIGSALVRAGLERCAQMGYGAVFLLGNPAYYGRFGFRPASAFGIRYHEPLRNADAFQALEVRAGALAGVSGTAREEPELG